MECIYCSSNKTKVVDKRASPEGIRRRRECLKCKKRFTTYEKPEKQVIYVIKKDNSKEKFDIDKIKKGVEKAFEKRPVSKEKIDKMLNNIESQIRKRGKKEIKSYSIGELVVKKIKKIDNIAYLRFSSVYKNFKDVNDFKTALKEV